MNYAGGDFVIIGFFLWCLWYIEHSIWSQREVEILFLPISASTVWKVTQYSESQVSHLFFKSQ